MPHRFVPAPIKKRVLCAPKPFGRNELSTEYCFRGKALPSTQYSSFWSLEKNVLNGFPLLFAGLFGES